MNAVQKNNTQVNVSALKDENSSTQKHESQ